MVIPETAVFFPILTPAGMADFSPITASPKAYTAGLNLFGVIGMISAFVVSIVVIRFLMSYIKKHDFTVFGWYRIVLGVLVLIGGITGFIG